ncbi:ATG C terminal domain-containing protein [Thamnocephalis sphaerospora]|uniref:Autophagy-related protein 2 n=1 Tax=Thamnocephalis sphaerospora TaxID=78915 RepID=A0A4P9XRI1_9FUNG|nr:ATG C terminal domain-containing protein [Thamnocephalis sphaerospora]|eukprot:RKP07930.1 ATG C terminal domain-containing protein [Thamnocephalis sphaerospora]
MPPGELNEEGDAGLRRFFRTRSAKLEVKLMHIGVEADMYEPQQRDASRLRLCIRDIEILDHIRTSVWKKFLTAMRPGGDSAPRESSSNMVRIDLSSVRPNLDAASEEELRIRILPLRFHIDQDALNFAIQFFNVDELMNSPKPQQHPKSDSPYFERFELRPIMLKIDYKPKKFGLSSLREGQFLELMNVFQLDGSEVMLREVKLTGVSGLHKLADAIQATWLPHIRYTQVPSFVSGVSPIRSVVNIGSGVADLVLLPIEQYRKDGRIVRGLQKGLHSFTKATAMEALKLGTKLAVGTQVLLEHADDILSFESGSATAVPGAAAMARQSSFGSDGGPTEYRLSGKDPEGSDGSEKEGSRFSGVSKYGQQPTGFNEGIELAYDSMRRNVGSAAHTIFAVPMEVYEQKGAHGSVKAVVRAVPVAVLRPMIGASEAFSKALMGLRNTIDPTQKLQMEDVGDGHGRAHRTQLADLFVATGVEIQKRVALVGAAGAASWCIVYLPLAVLVNVTTAARILLVSVICGPRRRSDSHIHGGFVNICPLFIRR